METMTTKEVAEVLGVSQDTVKNAVRRLMPEVMQQGVTTRLDEKQVAAISKELKSNTNVSDQLTREAASRVNSALTSLEVVQNIALALQQANDLIAQLQRESQALQIQLSQDKEWFSVKRVLIEEGREFAWRPLKKYSEEHGYDIKKVFDQNYGEVNAYHSDVWHAVYGLEL